MPVPVAATDPGRLVDAVVAFARDRRIPGIAVALVGRSGLVWTHATGYADLACELPVETGTVFRVGSVTKTLTAAAVMQLRDEGRLDLNDSMPKHLPELSAMVNPWGRIDEITIRRVLTHEAGLPVESPAFDWGSSRFPTTEEVLASLSGVELPVPPDAQVKYSNLGYQLLGALIERVSGSPFRTRIEDGLLEPLEMRSSGFTLPGASSIAVGHWPSAFSDRPSPAPERPKATEADGGLFSTVEDLASWITLQFRADSTVAASGEVLSPRTLSEMHRPRHVLDAGWTRAMALGWRVFWREEGIRIGHSGSTFGFASQVLFSPHQGAGAIVLANGEAKVTLLAERLLDLATSPTQHYDQAPPVPSPVASAPPEEVPEDYAPYLGLYSWEDHTILVRVEWRGGRLLLVWLEEDPHLVIQRLEPTDVCDVFIVRGGRESGEELTFQRNGDGDVSGFVRGGWPHVRLMAVPAGRTDRV